MVSCQNGSLENVGESIWFWIEPLSPYAGQGFQPQRRYGHWDGSGYALQGRLVDCSRSQLKRFRFDDVCSNARVSPLQPVCVECKDGLPIALKLSPSAT